MRNISEIVSGPPDPASAALGITVQLKCTTRHDANTPEFLLKERVKAAFSLDNYGVRWFLLDKQPNS
jgi:hypothetical protein